MMLGPEAQRVPQPRRNLAVPPPALLAMYSIASVAPLAFAAHAAPREESFWREIGIGVGMVAFAMLLLQFVLSGRLETLAGRMGIDLTMRWHQLVARTLGVLVILHPFLLVAPSGYRDLGAALRRLVALFTAPAYASGVAAWLILLVLILAGLLRRRIPVPYEAWRLTHALGGVVAAALTAHHAFRVGFYSRDPGLARYWYVLLGVAIGMFVFIYAVKPLMLRRAPYRVRGNSKVGDGVWEIVLAPEGKARFAFAAGQFAWFSFGRFPWPAFDHPFSISSSPATLPEVRILVKESGDFTRTIGCLPVGARAHIDGPHGNFTLHERDGDSLCLIAGGIGIAPIIGILRDLHANGERRPIALVFAAHTENGLVHREEIDRIAESLDLHVTYVVEVRPEKWEGRVGVLDFATIRSAVRCARPGRCLVFMCGPTPMMLAVERHLIRIGIPPERIVYERFVYD